MKYEEVPEPIRRLAKISFYVLLGAYVLTVVPGIPPTADFKAFIPSPEIKLEGKLRPNYVLDKAVKISDGEFIGAESIVVDYDGKHIYFGTAGGKVIKLKDKTNSREKSEFKVIAQYEVQCGTESVQNKRCGKAAPAGIRFDSEGNLLLVDLKYGILNVELDTGFVKHLLRMDDLIEGQAPFMPDDVDLGKDGLLYWSDILSADTPSMTDLAGLNGRLIQTDPRTNTHKVLINGLAGANGIQLSEKEDFVLVCETFAFRVLRYYLKGPKAGTSDIFIDGLPGMPDNVRENGKGGFYVALFGPRSFLIDTLGEYPQIRKLVGRLQTLTIAPFIILNQIGIQNDFLDQVIAYIGGLGPLGIDMASTPVILDVDANGTIERVLTTKNNQELRQVTQLTVGHKFAYMGGFTNEQIWKISMKDLNGDE